MGFVGFVGFVGFIGLKHSQESAVQSRESKNSDEWVADGISDCGLRIGDWGLGIGDLRAQSSKHTSGNCRVKLVLTALPGT